MVRACFQNYWQIEKNHSVLDDETLFNQDNVQTCHKNTIYNTAVLHKAKRARPFSYKAITKLIQGMELWGVYGCICNYWFYEDNRNF